MLRLVCELHASKRNVAAVATACDWKGGGHGGIPSPLPLDPPVTGSDDVVSMMRFFCRPYAEFI